MDLAAMSNAERWLEIAEVMSFEVHAVEVATTETAENKEDVTEIAAAVVEVETAQPAETTVEEAVAAEPELIENEQVEPRTARVLSISDLRQKLGIEDMSLACSAPLSTGVRPRIVRRREVEAYPELAAG